MTRRVFAVGDIHGCYESLRCVLDSAAFDPGQDELWAVGDMVNRGPQSLATLRYLRNLGEQCKYVLGNHDLHLLAIAIGAQKTRKNDTLNEVLSAPDSDELLDWLRHGKLIYRDVDPGYTMVHAGIPPCWTLERALALAEEVENVIRSETAERFFSKMYGDTPAQWHDGLSGNKRLRCIVNYLTRMRFCSADGKLDLQEKASTKSKRAGFLPWFKHKKSNKREEKIIFGHWAALQGKAEPKKIHALDTGCVWGGELTVLQLDNEKLFSCECPSF